MALGLLCVLCTSEQAGEITVSIVMACRIRVVAEQEPACLLADRNLEALVCRSLRPPMARRSVVSFCWLARLYLSRRSACHPGAAAAR
jgi:hypothetical protein